MNRRPPHDVLLRPRVGPRRFLEILPLRQGRTTVAIEAKSRAGRESLADMDAFAKQFEPERTLLAGGQGTPIEECLLQLAGYRFQ